MSADGWPYMSDAEIEAVQRKVSEPGYVPPPYPPLHGLLHQLLASTARTSDVHRVRVDSTWWDVLGWTCSCRYQAKCRCGWYGDETKSKVTAEQQAEWHLDPKVSHA